MIVDKGHIDTGFVGTAFQNGNDIIISYTGSEGLDVTLDKYGNISLRPDWDTDMSFALYNELSEQFDKAEQFYKKIEKNILMQISVLQDIH